MRQDPTDTITPPTIDAAEERPAMGLPGTDRPEPQQDPQHELPQRLGERIEREPTGIASGEPDLLPNVEVPETQM